MGYIGNHGAAPLHHTPRPRWHDTWWGRLALSAGSRLIVKGLSWLWRHVQDH